MSVAVLDKELGREVIAASGGARRSGNAILRLLVALPATNFRES
jgi:hypothetical protein